MKRYIAILAIVGMALGGCTTIRESDTRLGQFMRDLRAADGVTEKADVVRDFYCSLSVLREAIQVGAPRLTMYFGVPSELSGAIIDEVGGITCPTLLNDPMGNLET